MEISLALKNLTFHWTLCILFRYSGLLLVLPPVVKSKLLVIFFALLCSVGLAASQDQKVNIVLSGNDVMPAGPVFFPLKQDKMEPLSPVPEPVLASILAAGALMIFRRSRSIR